jgi:hypothetical protein
MSRRIASRGDRPAAGVPARPARTFQPIRRSYPDCSFFRNPPSRPRADDPPPPTPPPSLQDDRFTAADDAFVWQLGPDPEGGEA